MKQSDSVGIGPEFERLEGFRAWGRGIRTTNEGGQSARDQGGLWASLMGTGFLAPILETEGEKTIWGLYSNYEKDHTRPFDFTLAASLARAERGSAAGPEGGVTIDVPAGTYARFDVTAANPQEASLRVWQSIWAWSAANPGRRAYGIDAERWNLRELMGGGAVSVTVYISVNG